MKVIPKKTRVKIEFFRNVTLVDLILGFLVIASTVALFLANFKYNIYVALAWLGFWVAMFFPIADGMKLYVTLLYLFRFSAQTKRYSQEKKRRHAEVKQIIPFEGIVDNRFLDYKEYFAQVIEVQPIEFSLLNEYKQEYLIESFANALRRLSNHQTCSIMKSSKAMVLDNYVYMEDKKYDALIEQQLEGEMTKEEVDARAGVFEGRVSHIENINRNEKVYKDYFYIVVYDKDKEELETTVEGMMSALRSSATPITTRKLVGRDLAVFLRANFGKEFDERDLDGIPMAEYINWSMPREIKFHASNYDLDGTKYRTFLVTDYPLNVPNAWGAPLFMLDRTKVMVKFKPILKYEAEKRIDKAIIETETKFGHSARSSRQIENQTQLQTLRDLLASLKNNNQQLYEVNIYLTCEDSARKEVRAILKQEGFKFTELFGRQVDGFISSNISKRDTCKEGLRGIPTTSLAAIFPFISSALQDDKGFYIGYNEYPVFVDFFARNAERVNSNMMVIGKSGSGKSYATKTLLSNIAADNTKIFILDPENEYTDMAINLKGKVIDVGSSAMGIINPFHVMTSLKADEAEENDDEEENKKVDILAQARSKIDDSFSLHLQFLEQFFRVILNGMSSDAFETLNSIVVDVYKEKGIDDSSNFTKLKPTDYPIFDDVYNHIKKRLETEKNDYVLSNLLIIKTISKNLQQAAETLHSGTVQHQSKQTKTLFHSTSNRLLQTTTKSLQMLKCLSSLNI